LWRIAVIGLLISLPVQAHPERDEDGPVSVRADASDPLGTVFPSDLFTVHDHGQLTRRRVALPKPDCTTNPNDCFDIDVLNELDGFSLQPRITIPFTGAIDPASVTSETVFLICLGDTGSGQGFGERVGINQVVFDVFSQTVALQSDALLRQHARYLLVVTNDIRDVQGRRIRAGAFDTLLDRPGHAGAHTAAHLQELRPMLAGMHRHTRGRIVAASLFTTQSITADMEKIQRQVAASTPAQVDFIIGSAGGQPVRTVFPVNTLRAVVLKTQNGTAPTFDPPFSIALSILDAVPGAVGQLVYGKFTSPDYEVAARRIPHTPTATGRPKAQGTNSLVFEIFVPAGPMPPRGWPVVIWEHGLGANIYAGGAWRAAAMLASQGIATIQFNGVGHGGGPLGTVTVQRSDGPDVVFDAGGRGFDQDGNGVIVANEGALAAAPMLSSIGPRDAVRQWAVDSFQLVRQIQLGIDFDADGVPDLDASQIHLLGQSLGSSVAPIVLALEPAVRTGVLNVVGGGIDFARLGSQRLLIAMSELAVRKPSLINVGGASGFEFNENMPLRNLPPVTNTVPGAFAIARMFDAYVWAQQSGDPSAWAPHIRNRPLPGHSAKPVLLQIAKGDQDVPNAGSMAVVRAGDLADRAMFYRHDLAFAADPTKPKNPHRFLTNNQAASMRAISLAAQRQVAVFLASMGATTIDPDDAGPLFEMPIRLPLPETLDFIP
jgi:hypothetical protein